MLRTSNKCQGFAAPNQQHDNNSELLQQTEKQSEQASNVWSEDEGDSKVVVAMSGKMKVKRWKCFPTPFSCCCCSWQDSTIGMCFIDR
jgi:hypothetical protein